MKRLALIVVGVVMALGLAAPAAAYPEADRRFLDGLARRGIYYQNPANAVHDAYLVCQKLDAGREFNDVLDEIMWANPGWNGNRDLGIAFVVGSYWHYCPWHRTT